MPSRPTSSSSLAEPFRAGGFVLLDRLASDLARTATDWQGRLETVVEDTAATDCPEACHDLTGLLVRPDGIIVWATMTTDRADAASGLAIALTAWAGAPAWNVAEVTR